MYGRRHGYVFWWACAANTADQAISLACMQIKPKAFCCQDMQYTIMHWLPNSASHAAVLDARSSVACMLSCAACGRSCFEPFGNSIHEMNTWHPPYVCNLMLSHSHLTVSLHNSCCSAASPHLHLAAQDVAFGHLKLHLHNVETRFTVPRRF